MKKEQWQSKKLNDSSFLDLYTRLFELCISQFEWKNLPDTVDERVLETTLFTHGKVLFFKDKFLGFLCLPFNSNGAFNIYGYPTLRRAYSFSRYYSQERNEFDSVIIYNNPSRTPSLITCENYAYRLYEIQKSIDVNVRQQKTPRIIRGNQEQVLSLKNASMQIDNGIGVLFVDESFNMENLDVVLSPAPFISNDLYTLYKQVWLDFYTWRGIENGVTDKKERLVSDEMTANLSTVKANQNSLLMLRKQACKEINKMFDLNIDVECKNEGGREFIGNLYNNFDGTN